MFEATSGMYLSFKDCYDQLYFYSFCKMKHDWLKFKMYPHIGNPLEPKNAGWIVGYVTNPQNIASHKFLPLLHRTISQKKFRPESPISLNPSGKRRREHCASKKRQIYFPSHLDSIIYSYYSFKLMEAYEKLLADKPYSQVAVAYRKIANVDEINGNKCNIEFAKETFNFMLQNKDRKLSVIIADVTSFFDNLNHRLLHTQWKRVLGVTDLPKDHYTVFKSLVNYSYVNEIELFRRFQNELIVRRYKANDKSKPELKYRKVNHINNLRRERVVAFCTAKDFFTKALDLIRADKPFNAKERVCQGKVVRKGIPQGTPLSATLANIYMLDFDAKLHAEVTASDKKGYYQRYSDDLIVICDQKDEDYFYNLIRKEIENSAKLDVQPSKTHIFRYELSNGDTLKGGLWENGRLNSCQQLEYLGFKFDGNKVYVKTVSFSRFYRRMKRSFRRGAYFAKKSKNPYHTLFEWRLYKKFTHLGARRRLKWTRLGDSSKFKRTTEYDWGNFISYLNKSNAVMRSINQDDTIKRQYRKVWKKFELIKKSTYEDIDSHLNS